MAEMKEQLGLLPRRCGATSHGGGAALLIAALDGQRVGGVFEGRLRSEIPKRSVSRHNGFVFVVP